MNRSLSKWISRRLPERSKTTLVKGTVAIALALCLVAPASATTVTFDFTGGGSVGGLGTSTTFTDAATGLVLTATAQANLALPANGVSPSGSAAILVNNNAGLSVISSVGDGGIDSEAGEGILFSFLPSGWKLDSIVFSNFNGGAATDRAQLYEIDGSGFAQGGQQMFGTPGSGLQNKVTYTVAGIVADPFGVAAIARNGDGTGGDSNFRIASITVSQVPLPAAAWFMITGLAGLIMIRRRRLVGV